MSKEDRLLKYCQEYIERLNISCAETVYQTDAVIISAYEFIEGVCEIVGYAELDDEVN